MRTQSALSSPDWHNLVRTAPVVTVALGLVLVAALCGASMVLVGALRTPRRQLSGSAMLIVWPIVAVVAIMLGGGFWPHYWVQLGAPSGALAGVALVRVGRLMPVLVAGIAAPTLAISGWVYAGPRRDLLRTLAGAGALAAMGACSSPDGSSNASAASSNALPTSPSAVESAPPVSGPTSVGESATASPSSSIPPATVPTTALSSSATGPSTPAADWSPGDPAGYVNHGPTDRGVVALTFHFAGNPALVARLLDLLKANAVTSTLFAIGDWLTAHPMLGHRALDDGHELGNHTKSHQPLLQLDRAHVHAEIAGGGEALVPFIGSIGSWFRPSGTDVPSSLILEEAGRVGYPVSVGYDIDSRDYTEPGARSVIDNVVPNLHSGAIISLHFGHADTMSALPTILDRIAALGLTTATISQLLSPAPAP